MLIGDHNVPGSGEGRPGRPAVGRFGGQQKSPCVNFFCAYFTPGLPLSIPEMGAVIDFKNVLL
jgi:hypothetical protein